MKKNILVYHHLILFLFFLITSAAAQVTDTVITDEEADRYPNITTADSLILVEYAQKITELRRNVLRSYEGAMQEIITSIFRGTESATHANMGPVIANQLTIELMSQLNKTVQGLPLFSRSYAILRDMQRERDRAAAASQRFSIVSYFQNEQRRIRDAISHTFESDLTHELLSEFSQLPPDSGRTSYLLPIRGFNRQYSGRLASLVPSQDLNIYRTIVRFINATRIASGNRRGYLQCNIKVGGFTVTGNGNYDGLEASFPWQEYQSPQTIEFKIRAPMGDVLEEELNALRRRNNQIFTSIMDIQIPKVLVYVAQENTRTDALPGRTEIIRYQNGVLGRNNNFRRGILHSNQPIRAALMRFHQYVASNAVQYQNFDEEYTNSNWSRPQNTVMFARR